MDLDLEEIGLMLVNNYALLLQNYTSQTCQLQKFKIGRLWFSTLWKLGDFNQNREIL